jgi:NAD(P)-dependent dehydrogenase (short-subunit alcohol dehydrogenase family)
MVMKPPVLVVGAGGGFGATLVEALLESGQPAIAVAETREPLDGLARRFDGRGLLITIKGSVRGDEDAAALGNAIRRLAVRPVSAIVNLESGCHRGRLLDADPGLLEREMLELLCPQLHAARHLLPLLSESGRRGRYLMVGMPYAGTPWLGYGHYSIVAAATRMLVQVLRQESADMPVRVQQLALEAPVRSEENAACACPEWPDAKQVARHAVSLLASSDDTATFVQFDPRRGTLPQAQLEEM